MIMMHLSDVETSGVNCIYDTIPILEWHWEARREFEGDKSAEKTKAHLTLTLGTMGTRGAPAPVYIHPETKAGSRRP